MKKAKNPPARSATLAKGLDALNVLAASDAPLKLRDVAQALDMPKPTAHRLLATLADYGLARYDPAQANYRLGMRLFEMSRRVWEDLDLRATAAAELERLSEMTGEAIALALIVDDEAVYIDEKPSRHHLRERGRIGGRAPLSKTAIGKALIAGLQFNRRRELMRRMDDEARRNPRFPDAAALSAHLDMVNARGYAIEIEEHIPGIMGVAAPIVDHRGLTVAAIGLSGPIARLSREKLHELGPALIDATRRASLRAGGAPRPVSTAPRPAAAVTAAVSIVADCRNLIGESPIYDAANNRLFWVDICRPAIYRLDFASGAVTMFSPGEMITALALVADGLLVAAQSGLRIINPEDGAPIRHLAAPEADIPINRFNDGKLDSRGRFWVGTMALNVSPRAGALYRVSPDGATATMQTGLTLPNGIGWSPDERVMYLTDTACRVIYAYDYERTSGAIANRRALIRFPADGGEPDGMTVDAAGDLWVAMWDGWRVCRFSPDGALKSEYILPAPRPTSCVFGGADGKTLFVTSARIRVSEKTLRQAPHSGAVFAIAT